MLRKTFNRILNISGISIENGRIVSRWQIDSLSKRLFNSIDRGKYNHLLEQYWHKDEIRKAYENEKLLVRLALRLRLDQVGPLKILDIGGKAGTFAFICRSLGHEAWTTDLEEMLHRIPNPELFKLFDVSAFGLTIMPFVPLPVPECKYDLVTGFRTRFHSEYTWETGLDNEIHWGPDEWDFLLRDLANNYISQSGRIFFMLNRLQEKEKGAPASAKMIDYFSSVGGELDGSFLFFKDMKKLRTAR
jgi:hypothetical protein